MRNGMLYCLLLPVAVAGCGDNNTASNVSPPGEQTSLETQVLEAGAQILQGVPPIEAHQRVSQRLSTSTAVVSEGADGGASLLHHSQRGCDPSVWSTTAIQKGRGAHGRGVHA